MTCWASSTPWGSARSRSASHIPQDAIVRMARTIPGCRLATIEAGHLVHEERPGEFEAEVAAFLS